MRDLKALAIYPSIVIPTHYLGEPSYVSDTEYTTILSQDDDDQDIDADDSLRAQIVDQFDENNSASLKQRVEL